MNTVMTIVYCVCAVIGIAVAVINIQRVAQGCPPGQILIKSVATYECIHK